jgi:hypothetical protein
MNDCELVAPGDPIAGLFHAGWGKFLKPVGTVTRLSGALKMHRKYTTFYSLRKYFAKKTPDILIFAACITTS